MKLKWSKDSTSWNAEGKMRSYKVVVDSSSQFPFRVMQMLQPGGQVINSNAFPSLTAAQARAQAWEDAR